MTEYLDIVDENGTPTGTVVERNRAHEEGIPHRTSHVWLIRKIQGETEILLQKRCEKKQSFPGCYDISSAGHIPAGDDFAESVLRELKEELGVDASEEELVPCGDRTVSWDRVFHGRIFREREYSRVYLLYCNKEEKDFRLQEEEVSQVRWMKLEACFEAVRNDSIPNCIAGEELQMVRDTLLRRSED